VGTMNEGWIEWRPTTRVGPRRTDVRAMWSSLVPEAIISQTSGDPFHLLPSWQAVVQGDRVLEANTMPAQVAEPLGYRFPMLDNG